VSQAEGYGWGKDQVVFYATRYADLRNVPTEDPAGLTDYSSDGVDLTLIRWMLSLTPAERLEFLEQRVNDILSIRELNAGTTDSAHASRC
jgi:hypothetical protein